MAVPDYEAVMLPLLEFAATSDAEHSVQSGVEAIVAYFGLTEAERELLLPSGRQSVIANRVGWARTYLKKAGLLEDPRRGYFRITARGRDVLSKKPKRIDGELLRQFPEFRAFQAAKPKLPSAKKGLAPTLEDARTPEEEIEAAYQKLRDTLANELLETVKTCSPGFFERLVVDLLVRMGYGGTRRDAGEAIGKSGDGGIDGIIKEDRLGLDVVYIQAKRWSGSIGRPDVQSFAGALQGQKARKGVFITTSSFTDGARQFASGIDSKIILIDGEQLAQLMIDFGVGVATVAQYEMKRVDGDYFDNAQ